MTGAQERGEWLAERATQRPRVVTRAGQIIADGERSNDAVLQGRQWLERTLRVDPESVLTGADYRYAAHRIGRVQDEAIRPEHSEILETIADADWELQAGLSRWSGRYLDRPETLPERRTTGLLSTGTLIERGQPTLGIDGCFYSQAYFPHSSQPAVVVTSNALVQDAVVFPDPALAMRWWQSRRSKTGPLMTSEDIPVPSRPTQEEEILAYLMRSPEHTPAVARELGPDAMTSHLRAELLGALEWTTAHGGTPDYEVVARAFGRRLLRAPGWAAIGWPKATQASSYLERLMETSVTGAQARAAVHAVVRADAEAADYRNRHSASPALSDPPQAETRARHEAAPTPQALQARPLNVATSIPRPAQHGQ